MWESALRIVEGGVFQAEGTANAKAEIQDGACHVCVKYEKEAGEETR